MEEFHAILVDKSLISPEVLGALKILSENADGDWTLYKIAVIENDLIRTIKLIQLGMLEGGWYFHLYNSDGSRLIVVFKDKFFDISNNPLTWTEAVQYGLSLGTPLAQLDFNPNRFEDETL